MNINDPVTLWIYPASQEEVGFKQAELEPLLAHFKAF